MAGPVYTGATVLALCLLGCPPVPSVTVGTVTQSEVVYRREADIHVDPSEWLVGCFKTRDQLLPTGLLILDGDTAPLSRGAVASLRQRISYLEFRGNVHCGLLDRVKKAAVLEINKAKRAMRSKQCRL